MRTARTSLTVIVAALFLALGGTGCATVRRMDDCRGVKVEAGQEPIEAVDICNTNWLLLSLLPIASGDPDNPDGWTTAFFRNTVTVENQMRMLEDEARRVGARQAINVATISSDESVFLLLFLREKIHTSAVLVK